MEPYSREEIIAEWRAFGKVLNWINTQTTQTIDKKDLYKAVMAMRPDYFKP